MTYVEEAINSCLLSDELFYEEMLEQVNIERDFMLSCLENNIILEAEEVPAALNKGSWIKRLIEAIKNIFNRFMENVLGLIRTDEKWISVNVPKIKNYDFTGLKVDIIPYWEMNTSVSGVLSDFQKDLESVKYGDSILENLQTREAVERYGNFNNYTPKTNEGTFTDGIKNYFKTGKKGTSEQPKPVTLEGDALKKVCVNNMITYVNDFNSTILPTLRNSYNNFTRILNNAEKELSRKHNIKEGFCIIEDDYYINTELSLCENFNAIMEAKKVVNADGSVEYVLDKSEYENVTDKKSTSTSSAQNQSTSEQKKDNTQKTNTQDNKDEPKLNKVEDTTKTENNKDGNNKTDYSDNTKYNTFLKHAAQLNQIAIAAALTACEEKYRAYMTVLRGIVAQRSEKKK